MLTRSLTNKEVDDFFRGYLKTYGIDGGHIDFIQIRDWWQGNGIYPSCLPMYEIPINGQWGMIDRMIMEILFPDNYLNAIRKYREELAGMVQKK